MQSVTHFQLTQLLRQDKELQIILSYGAPYADNRGNCSSQSRIERLLSRIGMPSHLKGYQYLKTALAICLEDMEELDGITKKLYPAVARKHKTTAEKVEHAIRHAIESAWKRGDERCIRVFSVIVRQKENVLLIRNLLREWLTIFCMIQHLSFPEPGKTGGAMGVKWEIIWDMEKELKGVRNRHPDAFLLPRNSKMNIVYL